MRSLKKTKNESQRAAEIKLVLTGIGSGFSKVSGCINVGDKATRRAGETATRPAEDPSTREICPFFALARFFVALALESLSGYLKAV